MLALLRIILNSLWLLVTMAFSGCLGVLGDLGEEPGQMHPQTLAMELPLHLGLLPEMVDHLTLGVIEQGSHSFQEDLAVGSLISGALVRCVSSSNHWQARSSGSCRWLSWE